MTTARGGTMGMYVPDCLKSEHESIHAALKRATAEPGALGETARTIARIMSGHIMREEKFALRPLGLLKALARGETPAELSAVVKLAVNKMPKIKKDVIKLIKQIAEEK